MYVVYDKKELAIWLTDNPTDTTSGKWNFYNNVEDYKHDLDLYTSKYKKKSVYSVVTLGKMFNKKVYNES